MSEENIIGDVDVFHSSTFSIVWKIDKFFSRLAINNYPWFSPDFNLFGVNWYIKMYFDKQSRWDSFLGMNLIRKSIITEEHDISFEIGIRKYDSGAPYISRETTHIFTKENGSWVCYDFADIWKLNKEKDVFASDDVVTIFFSGRRRLNDNHHEAGTQTILCRNVDSLIEDFTELFLKETLSDATIKVKEREFAVHKSILAARCPVFAAMFHHDTEEKRSNVIIITDCDPDAFKVFLVYLYSAKLDEITEENVVSLYSIADKYQMQQVVVYCHHFILDNLSVENVCDVLDLALKHGETELKEAAEEFFFKNMYEILITVKWQLFMSKNTTVANELFIKLSKRIKVY